MPMNFDPNFLNLITQIMGGVSSRVNNAVLGTPMPTQGTPQSDALTDLAQKRAQAGQQVLGGVLSGPSATAQAAPVAPKKTQAALSPLQQVEMGNNRADVAGVLAQVPEEAPQQEQPNPTDQRLAMGTQASPMEAAMQPAQQDPGILSKVGDFLGPNFLGRLGNGLMVAGSQDPAKALVMLRQQEAEEREAQAKLAAAQKPKVTHLPGTPFFSVMGPNGTFQILDSAQLKDYYAQERENKLTDRVDGMVAQGKINSAVQQAQVDRKTSAEVRPALNETTSLLGKYSEAMDMISGQGTWAQIQGIPGISGVAGFFGTDDAAKNRFLQGLSVSETLLNTALTKGAISNEEMKLFKSPIPNLSDDREKVWKPFIEQRMAVLRKLEAFQKAEAARGERGVSLEGAVQASPQPSQAPQVAPKAGGMAVPGLSERASKYFN